MKERNSPRPARCRAEAAEQERCSHGVRSGGGGKTARSEGEKAHVSRSRVLPGFKSVMLRPVRPGKPFACEA
jgi:hypothetical protein